MNIAEKLEKTILYIIQISKEIGYNIFIGFNYRDTTNSVILVVQKSWLNSTRTETIIINNYTTIEGIKNQLSELYGVTIED